MGAEQVYQTTQRRPSEARSVAIGYSDVLTVRSMWLP